MLFQLGKRELGAFAFTSAVARDTEDPILGAHGVPVEEALVHVADLLHVESLERDPPSLGAVGAREREPLEGFESPEHGPVVDGQDRRAGRRLRRAPAPFEPGEPVRVEQASPVGGQW